MSEENIENILNHLTNLYKSYKKINDKGMQKTAERYEELTNHIKQSLKEPNMNGLIDFAVEIFNRIKWSEDDKKEISIINRDYRLVLIHILNIFIADKRNANLVDFENTQNKFQEIVNIIKGFRKQP